MTDIRLFGGQTRMMRPAVALIVVAVLIVAAVAVRSSIAPDRLRADAERRIAAWVGTPLRLRGTAEVRLMPMPNVRFTDVAASTVDGATALGRADAMVVWLSPTALLRGAVVATGLTLSHPVVETTAPDLDGLVARLRERARAAPPGRIDIDAGVLTLRAPEGGGETIEAIDATLVQPPAGGTFEASATLRWHGEAATFALRTPGPAATSAAGPTELRIGAPGFDLDFAGTADAQGAVAGTFATSLADPARFARWSGHPADPTLLDGPLALSGRLTIAGTTATLAGARLDLAGDRGEGALALQFDGPRPQLAGTLAFDVLDYGSARTGVLGAGWRAVALDRIAPPFDLDLRLSASRIVVAGLSLGRVAASLAATEGRLLVEIGNADLWTTPVSAALRGDIGEEGLRAQFKATAGELPLAPLLSLLAIPGVESGRTAATLDADLRCRRLGDCLAQLAGRLRLDARTVTVTGASPFGDVTRFHPIVVKAAAPASTSVWDRIDADLRFAGRRAEVDRLDIDSRGTRFVLKGTGDLVTGALDLVGNAFFPAFRPDPARSGSDTITIPIRVGGNVRRLETTQRTPVGVSPADAPPTLGAPPP
ncbi:hypothetical protein EYW49_15340 [Siculibacillus lacustris]|uniref:AsmA family protein n=1 Tax=Siculibacillus lacustris TaxID=1549641 RepID=A0A4Q9VMS8_9HYPH|nr:hypothetical protein [Siculibacillus lacustris]TBW35984.1 hypothetical protein EYW49_15340 [Siculibacillus lacustris]